MDMITLLEILKITKKKIYAIIAWTLVVSIVSLIAAYSIQTYTASVTIQYKNAKANEGLAPNGDKLNPYEIMDPTLISQAISNMEIGKITIEEIRNKLSLSKLVDSKTQEIIKASTEKGEEYVYNPTEYFVTFTYDKKFGAEFGKKLLYNILKSYDTYFIEKYYKKIEIDNFLNTQDVAQADYMDICNLLSKNISAINTDIGYLEENDKDFRSSRTGMKFSDLKNLYAEIQRNEYNKYYANVREGHLTKNLEKFITTYQDKVEATNLLMNISTNESLLSKETLQQFYNQYKSALNYDTASKNSQVENNNENDNTKDLVYGYDLSLLVNTYDDMILRYVNSGVSSSSYRQDIEYFNNLINDFSNDNVSEEQKKFLLSENEEILNVINNKLSLYEKLAQETIAEYYNRLVTSDIKHMHSVDVKESISLWVLVGIATFLGFLIACAFYILIEILKQKTEKADKPLTAQDMFAIQNGSGFDFKNDFVPIYNINNKISAKRMTYHWNPSGINVINQEEIDELARDTNHYEDVKLWAIKRIADNIELLEGYSIIIDVDEELVRNIDFIKKAENILAELNISPAQIYLEVNLYNRTSFNAEEKYLNPNEFKIALNCTGFTEVETLQSAIINMSIDLICADGFYLHEKLDKDSDIFKEKIIKLCNRIHIPVLAQGIESKEELEQFKEAGIKLFSGNYFSVKDSSEK